MTSFDLQSKFKPSVDQRSSIDSLVTNLNSNKEKQTLLGVTGSGKTFVMANIIKETNRPTLILSHNKTLAAQLYEEFKDFFPNNAVKYFVSYYDYYQPEAYLPGKDIYIEKESEVNDQIERLRFSAMNAAVTRRDTIIIASVSCIYNIGSPSNYKNQTVTLKVGDRQIISKLSRELTRIRYNRYGEDFNPGSYRIKGDVLEIFPPYVDNPIRIEFWGEDIERISEFDSLTGHKMRELEQVEIFPATSLVYENHVLENAIGGIEDDLKKRIEYYKKNGMELEAQRIEQKTNYDIEMLREVGYCKSMENYSIYFDGRKTGEPPYTLLNYFPDDYLLFVDESHITIPQVGGMSKGDSARKDNLINHGFRLPSASDNRPLNFNEFKQRQGTTIYFSATPNAWEIEESGGEVVELLTRPTGLLDPKLDIRPSENQIDDVIHECQETIKRGQRVLITTLTKKMAEDLSSYLNEMGVKVQYLHSDIDTVERVEILRNLRLGEFDVLVGINLLREGIDLPEVSLVIILDADKEGFLRSKTSLVQTIGRAARHVEGRVIMYADRNTDSMNYAISETRRRRMYQERYNKEKGITPKTIVKAIRDRLVEKEEKVNKMDYKEWVKNSKPPKSEISKLIKDMENKMFIASSNLQFEKAAEFRDEIKDLKGLL